MPIQTKDQKMAQAAFRCVSERCSQRGEGFEDYKSFALAFPALVHSCGLAQSMAFAQAKNKSDFVEDLENVLGDERTNWLCARSREADLEEYTRLSRQVLMASTWIKRYCQAKGE